MVVTEEDEYFPPPPELRELLRAVARRPRGAVRRARGAPATPSSGDREVHAAAVLTGVGAGHARP